MTKKEQLRVAFGHPFTTKSAVMEAMDYSRHSEVAKFFCGVGHVGRRYFTDDVIERVLSEVSYE